MKRLPPRSVGALVREASNRLAGFGTPTLDAQVLAGHALGRTRAWLYAHADDELPASQAEAIRRLVARRAAGEPVAHIVGTREFWSLPILVTPDVLIPRPETELLVDLSLSRLPKGAPCRIADLGTGSGAIALALASELPEALIVAVDSSEAALDVARRNAERLGIGKGRLSFRQGDWFEPLAGERFDLIVSNPPYVREDDPHLNSGDVRFEPRSALAAGDDGLDAIRAIIAGAPGYLVPGGVLILEHGHDQQPEVVEALEAAHPGVTVEARADHAGVPRAVVVRC